mmetsp:Transcript_3544/g.9186  ORF Transcript_3544/g.9186 Transcript_3544/m.9186 type:complete len:198 (-) Transcript_3544:106-699(-)|eukprot:CAMPEP_0174935142 /NCGR_PEP_ID=MMETSP1355-20121228/52460_1 /TAXON_ID=464990 /ORGANISM="Hemiselmis tepida, Strain CCMP443" /LENGTH=197 /DNA_ID=CAMNT_0016181805 /DNA_START=69 /DNA_END=662 /DNA_ORIENTATION=+
MSERTAAARPAAGGSTEYVLTAQWLNIVLLLSVLPAVGFALLNPISLFIICCFLFWGLVLSFLPKVLYLALLEYSIFRGRGSEFYHHHHSRRMVHESALNLASAEVFVVRAAGMFGGVEPLGRKLVAQARKRYAERPLTYGQIGERLLGVPSHLWPCARAHFGRFFALLSHVCVKWVALNVVARLYTKTPAPAVPAS